MPLRGRCTFWTERQGDDPRSASWNNAPLVHGGQPGRGHPLVWTSRLLLRLDATQDPVAHLDTGRPGEPLVPQCTYVPHPDATRPVTLLSGDFALLFSPSFAHPNEQSFFPSSDHVGPLTILPWYFLAPRSTLICFTETDVLVPPYSNRTETFRTGFRARMDS